MVAQNFIEKDLLLAQATEVPTSCDLVVMMGPTKALPDPGSRTLTTYLENGGKLLLALDPWTDPSVAGRYNELLKPYGLAISDGLIVDADPSHASANDPTTPAVNQYGSSPVSKDLNNQYSLFPQSTSIQSESRPGTAVSAIASSSDKSFLIQDPRQDLSRRPSDKLGPFVLMETAERQPSGGGKSSRVVLIGTASLAENRALERIVANRQLFIGSLDWLAEQETPIILPTKPGLASLTLTQEQQNLNIFVTLVLLPLLIVAGGITVWARRRLIR
jgi:ABC-type uncharacterized transport system involved in gliding motility auxiliary subunit